MSSNQQILEAFNEQYGLLPPPYVIIHPWSSTMLEDIRPKFVVVYDPSIYFARQIEVYKTENPGVPLRVYWLMYGDKSVECEKYVSALKRENDAFERLIHEKSIMIVSERQHEKLVSELILPNDSRRGGHLLTTVAKKVAVDMREFRSALPSVLHSRAYDIHPIVLDVGDYLLTPIVCVERKSVGDLICSFASGRLYNQIEAMCSLYLNPVLLIEFDNEKAFSLHSPSDLLADINQTTLMSKLTLLTLHFPQLRYFWTRSAYATVELFDLIKIGQSDPDPTRANQDADKHNESNMAKELLRHLPGMTELSCHNVMNNVENIYQLTTMDVDKLTTLLGNRSNAFKLLDFFEKS